MKTSSKRFFDAWLKVVESMRPQLLASWKNARDFTSLVKSHEDCVVLRIATEIGLRCFPHDYYGIDATFYEPSDLVIGAPDGATWLHGMSIAFEHENFVDSGLYKEVSHLLLVDADLRVLVTYPYPGLSGQSLSEVHALISASRHAARISEAENFLVIFGYATFEWEGFVYKTDGWTSLVILSRNGAGQPPVTAES